MIHVEHRVPPPPDFPATAERETARIERAITEGETAGAKAKRLPLQSPVRVPGTRATLHQQFSAKCAYCESPLTHGGGGVDHFRPRQNARGHAETEKDQWRYRHHYWWLAWDWRNLYLVCTFCERNKATWFPVVGERAEPGSDLAAEGRLLVDPCVDDPELYFRYRDDGAIEPREVSFERATWRVDRAPTTIKILGLNRPWLVEARRERMREMIEIWRATEPAEVDDVLERFVGPAAPWAGACRDRLRRLEPQKAVAEASAPPADEAPLRRAMRGPEPGPPDDAAAAPEAPAMRGPEPEPPDDVAAAPAPPGRGPDPASPEREAAEHDFTHAAFDLGEELGEELGGLGQAMSKQASWERAAETYAVPTPDAEDARQVARSQLTIVESLEQEALPATERVTAYVQRVRIESFRAIDRLELVLAPGTKTEVDAELAMEVDAEVAVELLGEERAASARKVGWRVLLGENGSGKSSVLHAVALALAGEERAGALLAARDTRPEELQRRVPDGRPAPPPLRVELELSNEPHHIVYRLAADRKRLVFEAGGEGVSTVVRGYGTSRLPPRRRQDLPAEIEPFRLDNLFDPHATLIDAEAWLLAQDDPTFERAALALGDLFQLEPGSVTRDDARSRVSVRRGHDDSPLKELSDGYQALTGLIADLMSAVPEGVDDFRDETGIVLVDELGVHLHPKWRMSVVSGLRAAFPKFQFLTTTHEPLCLRGLADGEVGVMHRLPSGRAVLDEDVPPIAGLRVDQLLTSAHFGLSTTIDPDVDREFEEYYRLLAREDRLEEQERGRLKELGKRLARHRVLGYTRRDQLVYEFIDDYLAMSAALDRDGRRVLKARTRRRVLDVWERVSLARLEKR